MNTALGNVINLIYPVGSLYWTSDSNFNPNTSFGGTWTRIKDKFILAAGDTYQVNNTGGTATTTLSVNNLPSHSHTLTPSGTISSHSHSFTPSGSVSSHTHSFSWSGSHTHDLLVYIGSKFGIENVYGGAIPASNIATTRPSSSYRTSPSYGDPIDDPYIEPTTINVSGNTGGA